MESIVNPSGTKYHHGRLALWHNLSSQNKPGYTCMSDVIVFELVIITGWAFHLDGLTGLSTDFSIATQAAVILKCLSPLWDYFKNLFNISWIVGGFSILWFEPCVCE